MSDMDEGDRIARCKKCGGGFDEPVRGEAQFETWLCNDCHAGKGSMQTEREKKFYDAIETIKNMIGQGLVTQDYAKKERVSRIIIGSTFAGPAYEVTDNEDRVTGYDLNTGMTLKIREPEDVLRQEFEAAKKEYDTAFRRQVDMSQVAQAADSRLTAIKERMVLQGIKP